MHAGSFRAPIIHRTRTWLFLCVHKHTEGGREGEGGGWAQRQRVSTTFLIRGTQKLKLFVCSWRGSNLGSWNLETASQHNIFDSGDTKTQVIRVLLTGFEPRVMESWDSESAQRFLTRKNSYKCFFIEISTLCFRVVYLSVRRFIEGNLCRKFAHRVVLTKFKKELMLKVNLFLCLDSIAVRIIIVLALK